jgi:enoyl-CoA hydratase/carnithine racemase
MSDIEIRVAGRAGRITFNRPEALNAMTYEMCMGVDAALRGWREDGAISLVVIDAAGDRAFCAGGDIAELYATGRAGNFAYGRKFWRDEYRLNAFIAEYPKPVVSLMQGFTMGGGVGIGCHASHRVVDVDSRIAMPECGIGLVPDVGGSYLLAQAPGHLGVYLGLTGARMDAGDAIRAGFADHFIPRESWGDLIELLEASGEVAPVVTHAAVPPAGATLPLQAQIDRHFRADSLGEIIASLRGEESDFCRSAVKLICRNAPLSMACATKMIHDIKRDGADLRAALAQEYRFTWRAMQRGDFLEGIRAQIIDKDRSPRWQYGDLDVPGDAIATMLAPLGNNELTFLD